MSVAGHPLPREAMRARPAIGYIAHEPLVYPGLSARENLELFAALYDVDAGRDRRALELVGLGERGDDLAGEFSRGMLARLAIARATLHDPELLLLDEPTAGLDADGHAVLRGAARAPSRSHRGDRHSRAGAIRGLRRAAGSRSRRQGGRREPPGAGGAGAQGSGARAARPRGGAGDGGVRARSVRAVSFRPGWPVPGRRHARGGRACSGSPRCSPPCWG